MKNNVNNLPSLLDNFFIANTICALTVFSEIDNNSAISRYFNPSSLAIKKINRHRSGRSSIAFFIAFFFFFFCIR